MFYITQNVYIADPYWAVANPSNAVFYGTIVAIEGNKYCIRDGCEHLHWRTASHIFLNSDDAQEEVWRIRR